MGIGAADLAIVAIYLLGMVALGVWLGRGTRNAADYLLGSRDLPWPALLISIVATETSTVTFLSVPGLAFGEGVPGSPGDLRFLQLPMGYVLGRLIGARVLLPLYFRGELFTAYEALQVRFGSLVRGIAAVLFLVMRTLADGLRLYLTAVVLQKMMGLELWQAVVIIGGSTLIYTWAGGVRAVVWTDVLQFVIKMLGAALAGWLLWQACGQEFGPLLHSEAGQSHLRVFSPAFDLQDPYTLWAGLLGGACLSLGTHGVDQMMVQRCLCARSQRDAAKALALSGVVVLVQFAFFLFVGLLLWAFYTQHPPAQPFAKADAVFTDFLVNHLPAGVRGIVLGAVFAAAMSTLSGSFNSSASSLVNDILLPLTGRGKDDPLALRWAKRATLLFGGLQICVGMSGLGGGSVVSQVLAIASFTTGILLGLFALALLPRPVAPRAALVGLATGTVITGALQFAVPWWTGFQLAWPWFTLVGSGSTFLGGFLAATSYCRRVTGS